MNDRNFTRTYFREQSGAMESEKNKANNEKIKAENNQKIKQIVKEIINELRMSENLDVAVEKVYERNRENSIIANRPNPTLVLKNWYNRLAKEIALTMNVSKDDDEGR